MAVESLSWGRPPFPLFPVVLRIKWAGRPLPEWVAADLNVPRGSTFRELDSKVWRGGLGSVSVRVEMFLRQAIYTHRRKVEHVRAFPKPLPEGFQLSAVELSLRTSNALKLAGLYDDAEALSEATFGQLFAIKNAGAASVLELLCAVEASVGFEASDEPDVDSTPAFTEHFSKSRPSPRSDQPSETASLRRRLTDLRERVVRRSWAHEVTECDIRFQRLLPPGQGSIPARIDSLLAESELILSARGQERTDQIEAAVEAIELEQARWSKLLIEDAALELLQLTLTGKQHERRWVMWRVLHWAGDADAITLEEAGALLGITRERVRQIEERILKKSRPSTPLSLPSLDRALAALVDNAPLSIADAMAILKEVGSSSLDYHPSSLLAFAEAVGKDARFELIGVGEQTFVAAEGTTERLKGVLRQARRLAQLSGATSLERLRETLLLENEQDESVDWLRKCLRAYGRAKFLDNNDDWFCIPSVSSTITSIVRKMLGVTPVLSIDTVRDGIRKVITFRQSSEGARGVERYPLPKTILQSLLIADGRFSVTEDGAVTVAESARTEVGFSPSEQLLLGVLQNSPNGRVNRATVIGAFIEGGLSAATATMNLTYSPLIEHVGPDTWCLVGKKREAGVIFPSPRSGPRLSRVLDSGWSPSGDLIVRFRAPDPELTPSLIIAIPAATRSYVKEGSYEATTSDGLGVGRILVAEGGRTTGYARFFRLAGVEEGDVVEIHFSTQAMVARLEVVNEADGT